jgi:hypothetical protein
VVQTRHDDDEVTTSFCSIFLSHHSIDTHTHKKTCILFCHDACVFDNHFGTLVSFCLFLLAVSIHLRRVSPSQWLTSRHMRRSRQRQTRNTLKYVQSVPHFNLKFVVLATARNASVHCTSTRVPLAFDATIMAWPMNIRLCGLVQNTIAVRVPVPT